MNALDEAIVGKMTADDDPGGLNEPDVGATGGFHQLVAPQGSGYPRIHFQELDDQPLYTTTGIFADNHFYQIVAYAIDHPVYGAGVDIAGRLAERARTLFSDASLTVAGKAIIYCRFRGLVPPAALWDTDSNNQYVYSKGLVLELWST